MLSGAIVPHAPLLLEEVSGGVSSAASATIDAVRALDPGPADVIVLLSPHGSETAVYTNCRGTLSGFGRPQVNVARETDKEAARFLAEGWGRPLLEREVDHGAVVPLSLLGERKLSVVVATIEESLRSSEAEERAKAFADAVSALAEGRNVWFLASFNTSAALSPRAPLTERSAGKTLDDAILSSLEDAEAEIPGDLWEEGGSCGAGPLSAWRHLFRGSTERLCYEFPYGVGYLVARA